MPRYAEFISDPTQPGLQQLLSPQQIATRVSEMGAQIARDYATDPPLLIGVLKGAVFFLADLARSIPLDCEIDFIQAASYGGNVTSSGSVHLLKDTGAQIADRHILLVEDILDTGITLTFLIEHLLGRGARSVQIAALLDKPARRQRPVNAEYVGFSIADDFVVGYGLDHAEKYRGLPGIYTLRA